MPEPRANERTVLYNGTPTSSCVQLCCWQLECLRATGWTRLTQFGSAQYPAAAKDTWVQTPHWNLPQGRPNTALLLPLKDKKIKIGYSCLQPNSCFVMSELFSVLRCSEIIVTNNKWWTSL